MRPLLLASALALAACTSALAPDDAVEAAEAAAERGDAWQALQFYKQAADQGDLHALDIVASAYEQGYVRAEHGSPARFLPILTLPGQGDRWRDRYERERDARALAGNPAVLMRVADDLTHWNRNESAADRDSARSIRQRLIDQDYAPALLREALVTMQEDSLASNRLLRRAEAAGSGQACYLRVTFAHNRRVTAAETTAFIDDLAECPPIPGVPDRGGERIVQNLLDAEQRGDPDATVHLDSLRALGLFERHPQLAALLES